MAGHVIVINTKTNKRSAPMNHRIAANFVKRNKDYEIESPFEEVVIVAPVLVKQEVVKKKAVEVAEDKVKTQGTPPTKPTGKMKSKKK